MVATESLLRDSRLERGAGTSFPPLVTRETKARLWSSLPCGLDSTGTTKADHRWGGVGWGRVSLGSGTTVLTHWVSLDVPSAL